MKPSQDLFRLICSLDKQEKRYFRLHAGRQASSAEKAYMQVFGFMEAAAAAGQTYDEEALRARFAGERFLEHLPSVKNYLYRLILEALENYNAGRTPDDTVLANLRRIRILYDKGLLHQALKLQRQTRLVAKAHGMLAAQLELAHWEVQLLSALQDLRALSVFLNEEGPNTQAAAAELGLQHQLLENLQRLALLERSLGTPRNPAETQLYHELGARYGQLLLPEGPTPETQVLFHQGQGIYNYAIGQYARASAHRAQVVHLLEMQPQAQERHPIRYMAALDALLATQLILRQLPQFRLNLDKLAQFKAAKTALAPARSEAARFWWHTQHLLNSFAMPGAFADGRSIAEARRKQFEDQPELRLSPESLPLSFAFFHFFFGLGEFRVALSFLANILNRPDQTAHRNLADYCRILLLITHYELGNIDVLEDGLIRNTHRYLSSRGQLDGIEGFFVRVLQMIIDMPSAHAFPEGLAWARPQLETLQKRPEAMPFFHLFNLVAWVDAKLKASTYAAELAQIYANTPKPPD